MLLLYVSYLVSETGQAEVFEVFALEVDFSCVLQVELEDQIQDT